MRKMRRLRGYELRCVLTLHLFQHGPATLADLLDMLDFHGFEVADRASRTVSDALRLRDGTRKGATVAARPIWAGLDARATEYRIRQRALALREEAAALNAESNKAFWDALFGEQA